MPYADGVIRETLRFIPLASGVFRKSLVDMQAREVVVLNMLDSLLT
jgi:hypothetical protein